VERTWVQKHLAGVQSLLDNGETSKVLWVVRETADSRSWAVDALPSEKAELYALLGMAYYSRKNFASAKTYLKRALLFDPANERAIYGMAYLAAYVNKDPGKTREWMDKLPESAARDNVHMIMMRSPECIETNGLEQTYSEVIDLFDRYLTPNPVDPLNVANLMHNAGRFFLVKGADQEQRGDMPEVRKTCASAVAALALALSLYGTGDMNLHHRAAANYWMSVAIEKLLGPAAAIASAEQSVELWSRQLALDPKNPHFKESWRGAADRLHELRDAA